MGRSPTLGAQVKGLRRLGIFRLGRVRVFVVLCESAKRVWHEKKAAKLYQHVIGNAKDLDTLSTSSTTA